MLLSVSRARDRDRALCIRLHGFDPRKQRHPDAPRTRADCLNGPRPCPWIACRYSLWMDIGKRGRRRGSHICKWHFSGKYECPSELPPRASCALDLADDHSRSGMTMQQIGAVWNLHPERVRQIEVAALRKVRREFGRRGIDATWLDALAIEIPESTFAAAMDRAAQVSAELENGAYVIAPSPDEKAPTTTSQYTRVTPSSRRIHRTDTLYLY